MILRLLFTSFLRLAFLRLIEKILENNKLLLLGDWALVQITVYFSKLMRSWIKAKCSSFAVFLGTYLVAIPFHHNGYKLLASSLKGLMTKASGDRPPP